MKFASAKPSNLLFRQACFLTLVTVLLFAGNLDAQIADKDRSHIVFDINIEKLRAPAAEMGIDLDDVIHEMSDRQIPKVLAAKIKRVYGSVELPNDMNDFQAITGPMFGPQLMEGGSGDTFNDEKMPAGDMKLPSGGKKESTKGKESIDRGGFLPDRPEQPISTFVRLQPSSGHLPHHQEREEVGLPINFFVRVELTVEEATRQLTQIGMPPRAELTTINGKEYFKAGVDPKNVLVHNPTSTSFEIGTTDYVTNADRKVLTERCKAAWKATPKYAIRLAGELESVADLVKELTSMASSEAPPMAAGPLNLVPKISTIQIAMDVSQDNLFMVSVEGKDEAAAEELNSVLSGLLMMGKGAFGQFSEDLSRTAPPAAVKMIGSIVSKLELTKDGNNVLLVVAKPANFNSDVKIIAAEMKVKAAEMNELNGVRQIVLSVHNYHDAYKQFPFTTRENQSAELSWRGRVSPFMEGPEIDMASSHGDPANAEAVNNMPEEFGDDGKSSRVFYIRPETPPTQFHQITDGTSNTIMIIKSNSKTIPWLQPGDLTIDEAVEMITSLKEGESLIAGRYDGSVLRLKPGMTDEQIRPFLTHDGGEAVDSYTLDR